MKVTDEFKASIESLLDDKALNDPTFLEQYSNKKKNLKDCCTYILNQVKKSGVNGFADSNIVAMAAEYYTTEKIDIGGKVSGQVVVNHTVELTDEEKEKAKEKAMRELISETKAKARKKPTTTKKKANLSNPVTSVEKAGKAQADAKAKEKKAEPPTAEPTLF